MIQFKTPLAVAVIASAAVLAGCGGGGGGSDSAAVNPDDQPRTITNVVDYINKLFANSENSEPVNINPLTLATDDTAEPAAL